MLAQRELKRTRAPVFPDRPARRSFLGGAAGTAG
jgi:hypothetical protein